MTPRLGTPTCDTQVGLLTFAQQAPRAIVPATNTEPRPAQHTALTPQLPNCELLSVCGASDTSTSSSTVSHTHLDMVAAYSAMHFSKAALKPCWENFQETPFGEHAITTHILDCIQKRTRVNNLPGPSPHDERKFPCYLPCTYSTHHKVVSVHSVTIGAGHLSQCFHGGVKMRCALALMIRQPTAMLPSCRGCCAQGSPGNCS